MRGDMDIMDTRVYYMFKDGEVIETKDLYEWSTWYEKSGENRVIARTSRGEDDTWIHISTVFLGLDHSWGEGPPLLFETLVSNPMGEEDMLRYVTLEEAVAGHGRCIEKYLLSQSEGQIQIWTNYICRKKAERAALLLQPPTV